MAVKNGNDLVSSVIDNIPLGMYYYAIPRNKVYETNYLGFVNNIESLTFNPFLEIDDIALVIECSFDSDKYGKPNGEIPKCYRIATLDTIEKELGAIKLFKNKGENIGQIDEPRLQAFPFRYFLVTDYINNPLLIKPELVESSDNQLHVSVRTCSLSQQTKYNIYVENYKGDRIGNLNGMVNSNPFMLPVTSSAYSQFLATSSSQFAQGNINAMLENDLSLKQGNENLALNYRIGNAQNNLSLMNTIATGITQALGGNLGGIGSILGAGATYGLNKSILNAQTGLNSSHLAEQNRMTDYEISSMASAKINDMINTPNSIKTTGNDSLFNLVNSRRKVDVIEYGLDGRTHDRILDYLTKYGYKVNSWQFLTDCLNSRLYFNFVKTTVCNIKGNKVPNEYLEEIKEIFNRGVTIWHGENAKVNHYSFEQMFNNREV